MTDKFKELLEMEERATDGPWGAALADMENTLSSALYEVYAHGCGMKGLIYSRQSKKDADIICASRNSIKFLIELVLKSEEGLKAFHESARAGESYILEDVAIKSEEALAAIEAFRKGVEFDRLNYSEFPNSSR